MHKGLRVHAVIPARNEAAAIGRVIDALQAQASIDRIVLCDNGSTDATAAIAREHGATVVRESRAGYGAACQRALAHTDTSDIVVFVDGDHSVDASDLPRLLDAVVDGADLAVGVRPPALCEPGAMTRTQILGNRLVTSLMNRFWKQRFTDLGPLRAIRRECLPQLRLRDQRFGWNVEMQIRALQLGLHQVEIPVRCRCRIGHSKISGNPRIALLAGYDMLSTLLRLAWNPPPGATAAERHDSTAPSTAASPRSQSQALPHSPR